MYKMKLQSLPEALYLHCIALHYSTLRISGTLKQLAVLISLKSLHSYLFLIPSCSTGHRRTSRNFLRLIDWELILTVQRVCMKRSSKSIKKIQIESLTKFCYSTNYFTCVNYQFCQNFNFCLRMWLINYFLIFLHLLFLVIKSSLLYNQLSATFMSKLAIIYFASLQVDNVYQRNTSNMTNDPSSRYSQVNLSMIHLYRTPDFMILQLV